LIDDVTIERAKPVVDAMCAAGYWIDKDLLPQFFREVGEATPLIPLPSLCRTITELKDEKYGEEEKVRMDYWTLISGGCTRTAGRSARVGARKALAGNVTTATVFPSMSKTSTL
jgi:hypothetical protein